MADTVLTDLKIHDFDSLEQMSQYESEIGENDLVFTPDLSCRLPLLTPMWFDHIANDVSWLHADNFSWHSYDKYKAVFNHLNSDFFNSQDLGYLRSDTIGDITIVYYLADDGHKICTPDQEANLVALYESTGVAWYYVLDTENKQFKLPRTKYGFTGLRDSVGGYVAPAVPNITAGFRTGSWKTDAVSASTSGAATQTVGGSTKAYEGGSNAYTYVDTTIDASASDPTYQDGATVQPPATQMCLYFYVGNFEQSAVEQTAGLNAELFNGKVDVDLNNINPSNSAKAMIVGWGMPDYSSGIGFSNNTDYTAPSDGFVIASGHTNTSTSSYFDLNGTRMATFVYNSSAWLPALVYCPVHKGDVIRINFTQVTSTMNFYPLKGV